MGANTGMKYLRSSAGFHLDLDEDSLRHQFGAINNIATGIENDSKKKKKKVSRRRNKNQQRSPFFTNDYERPRLDIFNQHCDSIIEKYNLNELHQKGTVISIEPNDNNVKVSVSLP